ncbi:MAG: hypothetical protein WDZ62_01850 [Candidatus Pacearchaeota archaeon]
MNNLNIYYDERGDFLEITKGDISNCYFDNLGKGIFKITDKESGEVKGIAIHSFKARTKSDNIKLELPFDINFFGLKT